MSEFRADFDTVRKKNDGVLPGSGAYAASGDKIVARYNVTTQTILDASFWPFALCDAFGQKIRNFIRQLVIYSHSAAIPENLYVDREVYLRDFGAAGCQS